MADTSRKLGLALAALCLALGAGTHTRAQDAAAPQPQDETEDTRQIKLSTFGKNRPAAPAKSEGTKPSSAGGDTASWNASTYHRVKTPAPVRRPVKKLVRTETKPPKVEPAAFREVGVTIWRLRPAKESDTGPGFQVLQGGKMVVMTPERVEGTAPVSVGDRVRLSVESPTDGYLYVIDREQYADGSTGAPALVFPTTRIRNGDNKVSAGRLVDIPDASDAQPFFTLTSNQKPGGPQMVGELVTILITPRPLEGITPGRNPIPLKPEQVAQWEEKWEAEVVELLEMNGGAGKAWTQAEKQAAAGGEATRALTQLDPMPQTVYRVSARPGEPLMITVQMLYGAAQPAAGGQTGSAVKP